MNKPNAKQWEQLATMIDMFDAELPIGADVRNLLISNARLEQELYEASVLDNKRVEVISTLHEANAGLRAYPMEQHVIELEARCERQNQTVREYVEKFAVINAQIEGFHVREANLREQLNDTTTLETRRKLDEEIRNQYSEITDLRSQLQTSRHALKLSNEGYERVVNKLTNIQNVVENNQ